MRLLVASCFGGLLAWTPVGKSVTNAPDVMVSPARADASIPEGDRLVAKDHYYFGTVNAVTDRTLTITCPGGVSKVQVLDPVGPLKTVVRVTPPQPPRTFQPDQVLAAGGFSQSRGPSHSYRLSDVRVGDRVAIECRREGDTDICGAISILRRPGGRVPKAPGDDYDGPIEILRWHDRCNAEQDWEEKGIPIPDKFGMHRRFPVAPPPREVKVGPAIAP